MGKCFSDLGIMFVNIKLGNLGILTSTDGLSAVQVCYSWVTFEALCFLIPNRIKVAKFA